MLSLETSELRVEVDPSRGANITFLGRPGGANALARYDWAEPLRASSATSYGSSKLDWLSEYRGGWQELFPNAGDDSIVNGVPLPFHGEVSSAPWKVVSQKRHEVFLVASSRLPLRLERRMSLHDPASLIIEERVLNVGTTDCAFIWGHHPAFLVSELTRIHLPLGVQLVVDRDYDSALVDVQPEATGRWPFAPGKGGRDVDLREVSRNSQLQRFVYLPDFEQAWAAVEQVDSGTCIGIAWDRFAFPHAWVWVEIGSPDFPFYGRANIIAIEPQSSSSNEGCAAAMARGQAHVLRAGEEFSAWLTVTSFRSDGRLVQSVSRSGRIDLHDGEPGTKTSA